MRYRKATALVLAGLALCVAVTGCGGSGSANSRKPGAASQIKANWEAFFNPKTPVAKRVSLLQDGRVLAPAVTAEVHSPLASTVSASVRRVTPVTASQAKVTYDLLIDGTPQLRNRVGIAVKEDGVWKVGEASFCGLLLLQSGGSSQTLPPGCVKS